MPDQNENRVLAVAEQIAAEGNPVTARAVQKRAHVKMTLAVQAARQWNEAQRESDQIPTVPETLQRRFDAIWREAFMAAHAAHQVASDGWATQIESAYQERDGLLEDLTQMQNALDSAIARCSELTEQLAQAQEARDAAEARAVDAADRASAAEGVASGLREALVTLRRDDIA